MKSVAELEEKLSSPSLALMDDLRRMEGDIIILGWQEDGTQPGKTDLKGCEAANLNKKVIGVSPFFLTYHPSRFTGSWIAVYPCDLLDDESLQALPDVENVTYMAGKKFGTSGDAHTTGL